MILHIVLYRPRPGLSEEAGRAFAEALVATRTSVPSVRQFWVGRQMAGSPAYRLAGSPDFPYAAVVVFDDRDGLLAYLEHRAHAALSELFNSSADAALICDFEVGDASDAVQILTKGTPWLA